ncbi:Oxidoreductase molybdopterin binding domain-containing protein [Halogeometricum rufum]|jgi:DMSO/TMAO reductase YedYZ molybdopterin-dependent catalytic subunit|uniref:Oxidoreductase molybdopterin binding domain-containing protein n=1 Tax=Halogeometricum rufum TaxID=553469 RepID=A0A1I6IRH7_9EURY|nr:molybdopterin-dependent oxidoreductase [Halogeometricum rufum]SFR69323.1 Oxidoreductase molybdopterin binding domain-containing protein [Halogeometricum rufum]
MAQAPTADWGITVVGERQHTVRADDVTEATLTTGRVRVSCASGDRYDATWRGVGVGDLLDGASPPAETTHLVFESDSGYAACVPVGDAIGGLVAVERDGEALAEDESYATRFVAPGVDGARFVKGVERIRALSLPPEADPTEYENLDLDSPEYEKTDA